MSEYRIHTNYANALYLTAKEAQVQDAVEKDMRLIRKVCEENRKLNVVLGNPTIKEGSKIDILRDIFEPHVHPLTMLFLTYLIKKRRSVQLRGIAEAYIQQYRKSHNIVFAEVVTAVEVNPELIEELRQKVAHYTGKEVELLSRVSNRMLGGYRMTFDNNMYDARIRTKIAKLRAEFSRNDYEKKL